MAMIEITSLADGHRLLLTTGPGNHDVFVTGLSVRDAAAVHETLHARRWKVHNKVAVRMVIRADALLALLEASVLPALSDNPDDAMWLEELSRLFDNLQVLDNHAGGCFSHGSNYVIHSLKNLRVEFRRRLRTPTARARRARRLIDRVIALRDEYITIDINDGRGGGGGGGQ